MDAKLLETVGRIAGIGGLALGVFLLLFRDVIRKNIFPTLSDQNAYRLIRQFMYLTFGIAVLGIVAWVYVSIAASVPQGSSEPRETLITDPQISPSRIPALMTDPIPSVSGNALEQELAKRGSLTLDNSVLTLGPPGAHISILIGCHTLRLQNGARILTNGNVLELHTVKFIFSGNSGIISFPPETKQAPAGPLGKPGSEGLDGGRVTLSALFGIEGAVQIVLPGQDGGNGGPGLDGSLGPPGGRGEDAASGAFGCLHGGGNGSQGGQGGTGGRGAPGGSGGDGGQLLLSGTLVSSKSTVDFRAPGGKGGEGGLGGLGGRGGRGGDGGSGRGFCSGGSPGPNGIPGPGGEKGPNGQDGRPGTVRAS